MSDRKKIIVGLSGGVDSSVTALRLLEQGHAVEGLFMKNWEDDDSSTECTAEADLEDAKQVCRELGIPLHQANFAKAYKDEVFSYCLREYEAGRTPNPDILCNQRIKFRAFLDYALRLGADYVATGHYARIDHKNGKFRLLTGRDDNKDQTYFLYTLGQAQLARALFPIGDMEKPRVREMAEMAGFDNFAKKDSTGICFIGERDFRAFLNRYIASNPGPIQTPDGQIIGEHMGLSFYTLGQRRGLDIGGVAGYPDGAWYVAEKDMDNNILIAVQGHDHPLLLSIGLEASNLSWVSGTAPEGDLACQAKTRYRQAAQRCQLRVTGADTVEVVFDEPQRAVTPGQSVVFYQDQVCLGGGIINRRWS